VSCFEAIRTNPPIGLRSGRSRIWLGRRIGEQGFELRLRLSCCRGQVEAEEMQPSKEFPQFVKRHRSHKFFIKDLSNLVAVSHHLGVHEPPSRQTMLEIQSIARCSGAIEKRRKVSQQNIGASECHERELIAAGIKWSTALRISPRVEGGFLEVFVREAHPKRSLDLSRKSMPNSSSGLAHKQKLEFALDAEELLKREDQGVSFDEFVRLILSPSQIDRLEEVINNVRRIPELDQQQEGMESVRNMVNLLQNEAEKVMRTTQRLSTTLRRLLDTRAHADRQRVATLLQEIKILGASCSAPHDSVAIGLALDLATEMDSPFRRTFWLEPPRFGSVDLTEFAPDSETRRDAFQQLAALKRLNWRELRARIQHVLAVEHAPTLGVLLHIHPADGGVIEVVGYLQIAAEDGHRIEMERTETVVIPSSSSAGPRLTVTLPHVTFLPPERN
jgi:hypothetical protein